MAIPKNQYFSKSCFFGIGQNKSFTRWFFQIESDIRLNRAELPHIAINGKINIISLPRQKTRYKPKYGETENMTESEPAAGIPDGIRQLFQKNPILKNQENLESVNQKKSILKNDRKLETMTENRNFAK